MRPTVRQKWPEELREISAGPRPVEAEGECLRAFGARVRAEENVEIRGEIGEVVRCSLGADVVIVMDLRRPEQITERADREANIRVNENRPKTPDHHERAEGLEREPEHNARQIQEELRRDTVEGVLAVGGHPIEVLGAVMDRMKAPQKIEAVARAVEPINEKISEKD